jgi:ParB-like chromosome segregation protein Spo0J
MWKGIIKMATVKDKSSSADVASTGLKNIPVGDIKIGKRHRKDFGDLQELANSITAEGLLQPIGITKGKELVFGQRRLKAFKDVLKRTTIPAVTVDVSSIVAGEYTENALRKDFTISERVAIANAIAEIESVAAKKRMKAGKKSDPTVNCPEGTAETRDIAAEKSGFGSGKEYERAKLATKKGSKVLIKSMDARDIPISTAALLAVLPQAEQTKAVKGGKEAIKKAVKAIKEQKSVAKKGAANVTDPPLAEETSDQTAPESKSETPSGKITPELCIKQMIEWAGERLSILEKFKDEELETVSAEIWEEWHEKIGKLNAYIAGQENL